MGAIGSNEPKFHKQRRNDVILQFARPGAPYENDGDPMVRAAEFGLSVCTSGLSCGPRLSSSLSLDSSASSQTGGKRGVTDYLKSLEFPPDSPWRNNRG